MKTFKLIIRIVFIVLGTMSFVLWLVGHHGARISFRPYMVEDWFIWGFMLFGLVSFITFLIPSKKTHIYDGMTINERLFHSGLLDKYEKAEQKKDYYKIRNILKEVEVDKQSIQDIIDKI